MFTVVRFYWLRLSIIPEEEFSLLAFNELDSTARSSFSSLLRLPFRHPEPLQGSLLARNPFRAALPEQYQCLFSSENHRKRVFPYVLTLVADIF